MSNRTAKLKVAKNKNKTPQMTQGPIQFTQPLYKLMANVLNYFPSSSSIQIWLRNFSVQCSGEPLTSQSKVAGVKQICHFMQLQGVIKIKMKKQRQVCVLNEKGQDGMTATVFKLSF